MSQPSSSASDDLRRNPATDPGPRRGLPRTAARLLLSFGLAGLVLVGALAPLAGPPAARAQDGRRFVDDDEGCGGQSPCHASIQAAVDAAQEGERIVVAPGVYTETVLLVDKALSFEGAGAGLEEALPDPSRHAIWRGQSGGLRGVALTVDARSRDLDGLRVEGFRFEAAGAGVLLLGRQPGDPLGAWPGLPGTALTRTTSVRGALVLGNRFEDLAGGGLPLSAGVVAILARDTQLVGNHMRAVDAGLAARGGAGLRAEGNAIVDGLGPGIELQGLAGLVELRANDIQAPAGRGIDIEGPLVGLTQPSITELELRGNRVEQAAAEGLRIQAGAGQRYERVRLDGNRIWQAGLGALAMDGAVSVLAEGGAIRRLELAGDEILGPAVAGAAGLHVSGVTRTLELEGLRIIGAGGPGLRLVDARSAWLRRSVISGCAEALRIVETVASDPGLPFDLRVGGLASEGNHLAGNGMGLVLERRGGPGPTHDVDARYNDWGLAWAPEIEEQIHHRLDEGLLGEVRFLPALGLPATVLVDAVPPLLEADGVSTSTLTARALDAAGRPAADGALVLFGSNGGRLSRPGQQAEAEDAGAVQRQGTWSEMDDARYGLASSLGYLRAVAPGAALSWTFDAPALVLRYGQGPVDPGRFRVHVDGVPVAEVLARGTRREWVEQPFAIDLGPGEHQLRIEALSGEVVLDRLLAGERLSGGRARSSLQAADAPGRAVVLAEAHGAGGAVVGRVEVPFVSGPPASMTLSVDAHTLPVGGVGTRVLARLRDSSGRPVRDGTPLSFAALGGTIAPRTAATRGGSAEARFESGSRVGPALVLAAIDGLTVTRALTLVASAPDRVVVTATRASLPANGRAAASILVEVRDAYGNLVADGTPVLLSSSLGSLAADRLETQGGRAETRLVAGSQAGEARVRAVAGSSEGSASLVLAPTDLRLEKLAEPRSVVVPGERVTFSLRLENVGQGSIYDLDLIDRLPPGLISPTFRSDFLPRGPLLENRSGGEPYAFRIDRLAPGQRGLITITARLDISLAWGEQSRVVNRASVGSASAAEASPEDNRSSAEVEVSPGAAYTVTVEAPERLRVGGERAELRVRVLDRRGNPAADGTAVFLSTDAPEVASVSPAVALTRRGLATAEVLSGQRAGETVIRALSVEERGGAARLRVLPGPAEQLSLVAARNRLQIGGRTLALTATLRDRYGNGLPEAPIRFSTDAGLLAVTEARTDATGVATSSLRSGLRVGQALVRASHLELLDTQRIDFLPGDPAGLMLELADRSIPVGGSTLAVARIEDAFGNPVPGVTVEFDTSIGALSRRLDTTDADGQAETAISAPRPGRGNVRALVAGIRAEKALEVRPARAWLPFLVRR